MPYLHDRVSVVIPLYNHQNYIEKAINSALEQTARPVEVIVIDDGSYDQSAAIARSMSLKDSRIRFWSRANRGAHETINEGIRNSVGEFVAILDSDDIYHPQRLEILIKELDSNDLAPEQRLP
jgi:glycosyltransferase involved in cell wall biosynthesis